MEEQGLLRVEKAAQWLDASRSQVFKLIKEGKLRSVRVGGLRRVPVDALREFVAAQAEAAS